MVTHLNFKETLFTAKFSVGPVRVVVVGWVEVDDSVERKCSASPHAELLRWGRRFSTPSGKRYFPSICIQYVFVFWNSKFGDISSNYKHFYLY